MHYKSILGHQFSINEPVKIILRDATLTKGKAKQPLQSASALSLLLLLSTLQSVALTGLLPAGAEARAKKMSAESESTDAQSTGQIANQDGDPQLKSALQNATQQFAKGDTQGALDTLKAWQSKFPNSLQLHLLLNTVLLRLNNRETHQQDLEEALKAAQKAVQIAPQSMLAHLQTGMTLTMLGRLPEAGPEFEKVIEIDPTSYEAWLALSDYYGSTGESEKAEKAKAKAAALSPPNKASREKLIASLDKSGNAQGARSEINKLIGDENLPAEFYYGLGKDVLAMGYFKEAGLCFDKFLRSVSSGSAAQTANAMSVRAAYFENSPSKFKSALTKLKGSNDGDLQAWQGVAAIDEGQYQEGKALIEKALGSDKKGAKNKSAVLLFAQGKLAMKDGDYKKAIESFEDSYKSEPTMSGARLSIAWANFKEGDLMEAMSQARDCRTVKDLTGKALALELRARLKDTSGAASREALKELAGQVESQLRQKPEDPDLLVAVAYLDISSKDAAAAKQKFNQVLAACPGSEEALIGLARLAKQEDNKSLAKEMLDKAVAIAPGDSEAKDLLDLLK